MEKLRFNVKLDRGFYHPGQLIEIYEAPRNRRKHHFICTQLTNEIPHGFFHCDHSPGRVDCVTGRLHGVVEHSKSSRLLRSIVDEHVEFWRHCSLNELFGFDENQEFEPTTMTSTSTSTFPIRIRIPHFAPPTFQCSGSPVTIRFSLEINLLRNGETIGQHEEPLVILGYSSESNKPGTSKMINESIQKTFHFEKARSIFVELILKKAIFSTTDKIEACINISNRWKKSLKYVHLNIVRKITALNSDDTENETIKIDTTGVGLPSTKPKIMTGESFSFRPEFNVPALPPNIYVKGLVRTDYTLKVSIGRAHNFVLSTIELPIQIRTDDADNEDNDGKKRQMILVDVSSIHNFY